MPEEETCYYCGAAATTREHVPPKSLFPEAKDLVDGVDYRRNLITVPSCEAHNSQKCGDDEYLQLILIHGYFRNEAGRQHFNSKLIRALTRRPAMLFALYGNTTPVVVDSQPTVAVDIDRLRFNRALEHVCQGLCFDQTGHRWSAEVEIHTPLLLSMDDPDSDKINELVTNLSKAIIERLKELPKLSDNPDIFWYQLLVDRDRDRLYSRMVFYGGFEVFAISHPKLRGQTAMSTVNNRLYQSG
jgi:hypothetical protein